MAKKKILWFDVETTGLNPHKNDIIQLAGLIEIDGNVEAEFDITCQPFSYDNISDEALDVHGLTIERIKKFKEPEAAHKAFLRLLEKYCDKFNKEDKFYPAGYNVRFDIDFLVQWFKKAGDRYLGSWINYRRLDVLDMLYIQNYDGKIETPKFALETIAEKLYIPIVAHDAMSDIKATRAIWQKLREGK